MADDEFLYYNFKFNNFYLFGCSTITSKNTNSEFKVILELIQVSGSSLESESLPEKQIVVLKSDLDPLKVDLVQKLVMNFNRDQDELMVKLFSHFYSTAQGPFRVILTAGIPSPFDAWTAKFEGKFAIFINLSEWTIPQLEKSGLGVVKHEVTHVLLEPLLKSPSGDNILANLDHIVIDEGIAHFIGVNGNRSNYFANKNDQWKQSEIHLAKAQKEISLSETSEKRKSDLLKLANSGPFWQKFGSISGMFRANFIYQKFGIKGLVKAIESSKLERAENY